jgi:hypothetical protein
MSKISTKQITEPLKTKMNEENDNSNQYPYEPGDSVINNILNYSKALSIRKSKNVEHIELVLN